MIILLRIEEKMETKQTTSVPEKSTSYIMLIRKM